MYYICDVRRPDEPFLFSKDDVTLTPAVYADKAKAEEMCQKMNEMEERHKKMYPNCIMSTRYEVKERVTK